MGHMLNVLLTVKNVYYYEPVIIYINTDAYFVLKTKRIKLSLNNFLVFMALPIVSLKASQISFIHLMFCL